MSNFTLGEIARQEIRASLQGLTGSRAKSEAQRLAIFHQVSLSRIYEITRDLRPKRKSRSDKGKRKANLMTDPKLRLTAEIVVNQHVKPDLAIEVRDPRIDNAMPVSVGTLRRYLREHGISRKANARDLRAHRSFEAKEPLDIFQLDMTGLKKRWQDTRTRRILAIDIDPKNHPNTNRNLVRLWSFVLKDDHSRFTYQRFLAVDKPNSSHVIEFLLEAFRELGIPKNLYSDNDAVIVSQRMQRASSILDKAFEESGGFKLIQHRPLNPQATGKVERAHQVVEEFEKLIGVKYKTPTLDELNNFSRWLCDRYNSSVSRATGEEPRLRFRAGHAALRIPPAQLLDAAFKADLFDLRVNADVTITVDKVRYQLPRAALIRNAPNPFLYLAESNGKIQVVWPPDVAFFTAILADGTEYTLDRIEAQTDAAGEFKAMPETIAQQSRKELRVSAAGRKRELQAEGKELVLDCFNPPAEQPAASTSPVAIMPRQKIATDPSLLSVLTHGLSDALDPGVQLIDYWTAVALLQERDAIETPPTTEDQSWLKSVFAARAEIPDTELWAALDQRGISQTAEVIQLRRNA